MAPPIVTQTLQFAYPTDDLAPQFTPTLVTGTQAAGYPIANLSDDDPAHPWKTDTTTFDLLWDFGTAKTVKMVGLIHPNFQSGLTGVTFKMGNTTDTLSLSRSFVIGPYGEDGYPPNPYLDLSDANPAYRYARLVANAANIVPISIGRFVMVQELRGLRGFIIPKNPTETEEHPITENSTDAGVVTIFSLGVRRRSFTGEMVEDDINMATLRSWRRSSQGRSKPFALLPHLQGDDLWFARFNDTKIARSYIGVSGLSSVPEGFEEVSRGLKPTPSAV